MISNPLPDFDTSQWDHAMADRIRAKYRRTCRQKIQKTVLGCLLLGLFVGGTHTSLKTYTRSQHIQLLVSLHENLVWNSTEPEDILFY